MNTTISKMPVEEFRAAGFVQELNRRFLHPHGLALEVAVPDREHDGGEVVLLPTTPGGLRVIAAAAQSLQALYEQNADPETRLVTVGDVTVSADEIADLIAGLETAPEPVKEWLNGVWDFRDDPEGIFYGGLSKEERARAAALDEIWQQRRPLREARLGFMIEPA